MDFEKTKVASSIEYSVKGLPAAAAAERLLRLARLSPVNPPLLNVAVTFLRDDYTKDQKWMGGVGS